MPKRVIVMAVCITVLGLDLILQAALFAVYGHVSPWNVAVPAIGMVAAAVNLASQRSRS